MGDCWEAIRATLLYNHVWGSLPWVTQMELNENEMELNAFVYVSLHYYIIPHFFPVTLHWNWLKRR